MDETNKPCWDRKINWFSLTFVICCQSFWWCPIVHPQMGRYICYDLSTDVGNTLEQCNEGQSMCRGWGSARTHRQGFSILLYTCSLYPFWDVQVSLFQTLLCLNIGKKKGAQNKEDKTQPGVTFCETSPLSNGDKNMGYWRKPVGEKQGWGEPNYNGL